MGDEWAASLVAGGGHSALCYLTSLLGAGNMKSVWGWGALRDVGSRWSSVGKVPPGGRVMPKSRLGPGPCRGWEGNGERPWVAPVGCGQHQREKWGVPLILCQRESRPWSPWQGLKMVPGTGPVPGSCHPTGADEEVRK